MLLEASDACGLSSRHLARCRPNSASAVPLLYSVHVPWMLCVLCGVSSCGNAEFSLCAHLCLSATKVR